MTVNELFQHHKSFRQDVLDRLDALAVDQSNHASAVMAAIATLSQQLTKQGDEIMADLTALTAQVAQNTSVEASAVTLIQGLAAQIAAAGTDPAKLQALQDQLNTSATALAAAVAANTTPPAPAP